MIRPIHFATLLVLSPGALFGAAILSNLPTVPVPGLGISAEVICSGAGSFCFSSSSEGVGFTIPQNVSFQLDSIVLSFDVEDTNLVSVQVFADSGLGSPGTLLQTLITPLLDATPGTIDNATFTNPSPLLLAAGTEYWFILSNSDPNPNNGIQWAGNFPATVPTGIATCASILNQQGANSFILPCAGNGGNFPQGFTINATSTVPESSQSGTCALAIGALIAFARSGRAVLFRRR